MTVQCGYISATRRECNAGRPATPHQTIPSDHARCNNECPVDGANLPTPFPRGPQSRDLRASRDVNFRSCQPPLFFDFRREPSVTQALFIACPRTWAGSVSCASISTRASLPDRNMHRRAPLCTPLQLNLARQPRVPRQGPSQSCNLPSTAIRPEKRRFQWHFHGTTGRVFERHGLSVPWASTEATTRTRVVLSIAQRTPCWASPRKSHSRGETGAGLQIEGRTYRLAALEVRPFLQGSTPSQLKSSLGHRDTACTHHGQEAML